MRYVLGVDSSTQSCKVEVRDLDSGRVVATGASRHPPTSPPISEQDPLAWWSALVSSCAALPRQIRAEIGAISVAGQQHGLVLLDADGSPVRAAKLWNDTTSAPQADAMVAALGSERWAELIGSRPVAAFTITKLAWVAEHEPDVLDSAALVMLPHDFLTFRLCGEHVTDRGDASGSGWFSPSRHAFVPEAFTAAGLDPEIWEHRLPSVLLASEVAGQITAEGATALGVPADVVVGPGTGDNMGAALGLGLRVGDVAISLGTSGTVFAVSATPTHDPSGAVAGFAAATGDYLPLVCTLNATKVTDTVARWLGTDAPGLAALAMEAIEDSGDAMLVPYFDGERTPNLPDATGTLIGLTNATTREQLALAAHDGVLCGVLAGLDALREVGAACEGRLFLVGGGARSSAYRQRLADLAGQPIVVPDTDETVATGAALQAAVVAGGGDFAAVADRWQLGTGDTIAPDADGAVRRAAYRRSSSPG